LVEHKHRTWHRDWGESCAFLVVLVLYFCVPNRYTLGGVNMGLLLGTLLAAACGLSIVVTIVGSRRGTRIAMLCVAAVLTLILFASLSRILYLVVYQASTIDGARLLSSALVIWISNVVLFGVIYRWLGDDDFIFPEKPGTAPHRLVFLDFLFLSFTTATAFSPTDTPPMTTAARMLMMLESLISLATIAIAAARAINILH
jgi:hypothetical protein